MKAVLRAAVLVGSTLILAPAAGATQAPAPADPAAPAPPAAAPGPAATDLLDAADAAIDAGDIERASGLYRRVMTEHPTAREAKEAGRALKILKALPARPPAATSPLPPSAPLASARPAKAPPSKTSDADTVMRLDPYSTRTAERLRLTTWEKLDFGITSFLYGMSVGASYAVSLEDDSEALTPVALGALTYTLGSVAYLSVANPDRGDLPLALAITSYVPTSTLLFSNLVFPDAKPKTTAIAVTLAGLAAVPLAVFATERLNLDPGDTQLVRDAGFWGLVLGTAGSLGFGAETLNSYGYEYTEAPSTRAIAGWAAVGLVGGLSLGAFAAANSEVSLERVRVTTWGGYGGALLGTLLTAGAQGGEEDVFKSLAIGSALGLAITFLSTRGLDGIPPETAVVSRLLPRGMTPAVLAAPGLEPGSSPLPVLGFVGALP